jgi:hypothetical protein
VTAGRLLTLTGSPPFGAVTGRLAFAIVTVFAPGSIPTVPLTACVAGKFTVTGKDAFCTVTGSELFPIVTVPDTPTESVAGVSGLVSTGLADVFTTVVGFCPDVTFCRIDVLASGFDA